jgi:hypothetical protein
MHALVPWGGDRYTVEAWWGTRADEFRGFSKEVIAGMRRSRLFRFRDRASYKSSEVLALFVMSIFLGMLVYVICLALSWIFERIFPF